MHHPNHSLLATALMGGLLLAGAAGAQEGDDMFRQMDANGDGRISAQEHDAGASAMFTRMDANNDGKVSGDETKSMGPHGGGAHGGAMKHDGMKHDGMGHDGMLTKADSNQDGAVTAAEHAAAAKAMFDRMDANQDGRIAGTELDSGHQGMREHGHGDGGKGAAVGHAMAGHDNTGNAMAGHDMAGGHAMPGDHSNGGKGMRADGDMAPMHANALAMMDANKDGTITAAEHAAGARAMFARIDANDDGFVSRTEFDAGMKAMRTP